MKQVDIDVLLLLLVGSSQRKNTAGESKHVHDNGEPNVFVSASGPADPQGEMESDKEVLEPSYMKYIN